MGTKQFDNYADLITFTRASGATLLDSDGLLKRAGHNLLTYSEQFDNAAWTLASGASVSANETGPDGVANSAYTFTDSSGFANGVYNQISVAANTNSYTCSIYIKKTNSATTFPVIGMNFGLANVQGDVIVNTNAGTITDRPSAAPSSSSISDAGEYWKVSVTQDNDGSQTSARIVVYPAFSSDGATVDASLTGSCVCYGAHLYRSDMPMVPNRNSGWTAETTYYPTTSAAYEAPRIEYDADGNRLGLLVEEQRTNLLERSEEFDNAYWDKTRLSIDSNVIVAPDGTLTGDKFIDDTSTDGAHFVNRVVNTTNATISIYAKAAEYSKVAMKPISGAFGSTNTVIFDLNAIVADTQSTGFVARIVDVGNGWRRCSVYKSGTLDRFIIANVNNSGDYIIYPGDGTSGVYLWGAQLEAGAFPTSYIPTSGSTATRAADVASIPTSAFGYNASEGTVVVEVLPPSSTANHTAFNLRSSNGVERWQVRTSSSQYVAYSATSGGSPFSLGGTAFSRSLSNYNAYKAAYSIKSNDAAFVVNGNVPGTDVLDVSIPKPTELALGFYNPGQETLNGHIKSIKYYPRRLSNAQLQELTQ